jgi:hypothetical protein
MSKLTETPRLRKEVTRVLNDLRTAHTQVQLAGYAGDAADLRTMIDIIIAAVEWEDGREP